MPTPKKQYKPTVKHRTAVKAWLNVRLTVMKRTILKGNYTVEQLAHMLHTIAEETELRLNNPKFPRL